MTWQAALQVWQLGATQESGAVGFMNLERDHLLGLLDVMDRRLE